jgi:hypothetical protein
MVYKNKKTKKKKQILKKNPVGRPIFDGKGEKETLQKIEEAWEMGCTDEEACLHADISMTALYMYQSKHPKFLDRKKLLKQNPFLKARKAILNGLEDDHKFALDFMKSKKSDEFSSGKTKIDGSLNINKTEEAIDDELDALDAKISKAKAVETEEKNTV